MPALEWSHPIIRTVGEILITALGGVWVVKSDLRRCIYSITSAYQATYCAVHTCLKYILCTFKLAHVCINPVLKLNRCKQDYKLLKEQYYRPNVASVLDNLSTLIKFLLKFYIYSFIFKIENQNWSDLLRTPHPSILFFHILIFHLPYNDIFPAHYI